MVGFDLTTTSMSAGADDTTWPGLQIVSIFRRLGEPTYHICEGYTHLWNLYMYISIKTVQNNGQLVSVSDF
jgi:hypothetical protein